MRPTADSSWRRISASTAARSVPTRMATRSLRTRSRVGVGTSAALVRNDAILDPDLRARCDGLDLRDGEPIPHLGDAGGADLLVQLAEHLAGHRMHDRDPVPPEAHAGAALHAVRRGEIDDDPAGVDVHHVAALGL